MIQLVIPRLPARDMEETKSFYVNKLSFQVRGQYYSYLMLSKNSVEIHFYYDADVNPKESDHMIYLRVSENITVLYDELLQKGVQTAQLGKLEKKPWGQREFAIIDPNGTLLTFGQAENN